MKLLEFRQEIPFDLVGSIHVVSEKATLSELIYSASIYAFQQWRKAHPNERIFAFALSAFDYLYISANVNTVESCQRRLTEHKLERDSLPGLNTKWKPWRWEYERIGQEEFCSVNVQIQQKDDPLAEGDFKTAVLSAMVDALVAIKKNQVITNDRSSEQIVLFATIYDSYHGGSVHRRSAELLNSPSSIEELLTAIGG